MNKFIINSILAVGLVSGSGLAFAQEATMERQALKDVQVERKDALKAVQVERKDALRAVETDRKDALKAVETDRRAAVKGAQEAFKKVAEERKAALEKTREEFKTKAEAVKGEFEKKREAQKEELKTRLQKVKDEKKKATVERLDNRFTEINQKFSNKLLETLNRLDDLLAKVSSRADKATANGGEVTAVRFAIEKAKTSIAGARTAVGAQLNKTYVIGVIDEPALKSAVATAKEALNKDLKAVRELAQAAHKAVVEANQLLKGISGVDNLDGKDNSEAASVEQSQ